MQVGSEVCKEAIAGLVDQCAACDANLMPILSSGILPPLIQQLHSRHQRLRNQACKALAALIMWKSGWDPFFAPQVVADFMEVVAAAIPDEVQVGVCMIESQNMRSCWDCFRQR